MSGRGLRTLGLVAALLAWGAVARIPGAAAQDPEAPVEADSVFQEGERAPIGYATSYDLNISRGVWLQTLDYSLSKPRVAFVASANLQTVNGVHGQESDGIDGQIFGRLDLRATSKWIWTLDGRFGSVSQQSGSQSSTDIRQNNLQLRTQYSANPNRQLSLIGILYGQIQQNQSVGNSVVISQGAAYTTRTDHDSSYTSGHGNGFNGSANWRPNPYLLWRVSAAATRLNTTTKSFHRDFIDSTGARTDSIDESTDTSDAPNGDQRIESRLTYTGFRRTTAELLLKGQSGEQEYTALNKGGAQEHINAQNRGGVLHVDHVPRPGARIAVDAAVGRVGRLYAIQKNLNTLVHSGSLSGAMSIMREKSRGSLTFDLGRSENSEQVSQNGTTINRVLGLSGARWLSRRLGIDGIASISLISRSYVNTPTDTAADRSDRDDQRLNVNVGGGYLVSRQCSTTVHFSVNRAHAVALSSASSANNNVQTSYNMDASLRLQVTRNFLVLQNYQLNAAYYVYDYPVSEGRNTLTRIRRIDTFMIDSLFPGVYLRLAHNFWYQDRGSYTSDGDGGNRLYDIATETYQQNLGVTLGVRPIHGVLLTVTESLANTKTYELSINTSTVRNRWNLNYGAIVDRELPAGIALTGSIQHISEYTEPPPGAPSGVEPTDEVDYWLAGAGLTKEF